MGLHIFSVALVASVLGEPALAAAHHDQQSTGSHFAGSSYCEFDSTKHPGCWGEYSIHTNYYENVPDTGVTHEYSFDIEQSYAAPDGIKRAIMTVNGQFPGPTLFANRGDWVVIHVNNLMPDNGTSIHWHGIRQYQTNDQDGVPSITQCPIAPSTSMAYKWRATQYGHSWYHSLFALQAWNGVFGGIVINGPASAPYAEDLGVLFLTDWFHQSMDTLWPQASMNEHRPDAQNGLINGTNIFNLSSVAPASVNGIPAQ